MSVITSICKIWPAADTAVAELVDSAAELKLIMTLARVQCQLPDWGLNTNSRRNFLETGATGGRATLSLFPCFFRNLGGECRVVRKGITLCEDRFPGTSFHAILKQSRPSHLPPPTYPRVGAGYKDRCPTLHRPEQPMGKSSRLSNQCCPNTSGLARKISFSRCGNKSSPNRQRIRILDYGWIRNIMLPKERWLI